MNPPLHVLAFAGSLRRQSHNKWLLEAARELAPDGMTVELFDLAAIPLYNPDVEAEGLPDAVADFKARIAAADALLIATPEYNHSIPGVLKNAIDWASRPFRASPLQGKPVAILGAAGRLGASRAQAHLRQIVTALDMFPLNRPEVLVAHGSQHFDENGRLTDERTARDVAALLQALDSWTRRLHNN